MKPKGSQSPPWLLVALWCLCLVGLALRGWLVDQFYPTGGDPLHSYAYRAMLIAAGKWEGVFLMWHPPGYPLLLAGVTTLTGGLIPVYWVGVGLSLGSYVGLFWIVDQLVGRRAHYVGTRLVAASFIALYETLFMWAAAPLTEPVYLLLLYGVVLLLDRERPGWGRAFLSGALLGAAFTVRSEAAGATAGVGLYLAVRTYQTGGWRAGGAAAAAFAAGWFLVAGWLVAHFNYLQVCAAGQFSSYTIPPVQGLFANVRRAAECAYHAATVWLPFALLLPYWVLLGAGLTHRAAAPRRPVLHGLLLAIVVPSLIGVGLTIMHKRTASFLLPAAAIWVGLGTEMLARRWAGRSRWVVAIFLGVVIGMNILQAARIGFSVLTWESIRNEFDCVAAEILRDSEAEPGPVWAFGSEPDIYTLCGWPIVYPFWEREADYNKAYSDHVGDPAGFVADLRRRKFRYLAFVLAPVPQSAEVHTETQPYSGAAPFPERADLELIAADCGRFGLESLGIRDADHGRTRAHVYRLR